MSFRQCGHDNNGDQATPNDKKQPKLIQKGQEPIPKNDERAATPRDEQKRNVDHIRLDLQIWMEDCVHLYDDIGRD